MSSNLQVKVLTSSGKTRAYEGLEAAYNKWIEETEGTIDIYTLTQSESVINSTPHITLTIFYKINFWRLIRLFVNAVYPCVVV